MNRCPPAHGLKRTGVRGHAWSIGNELKYIVRYWSGQQKRATCFATLPQNELKSDFTRFSAHVHTCLVALSGCPGCVKLFQKVESTPSFCNKICSCCSVILPAQVKLACSKWRNSCVWPDFPVILSSEKSVFTPATLATLCCKTGLNVGGESATSLFNSFCRNVRNKIQVMLPVFGSSSYHKNRWNRNLMIRKLGTVRLTSCQNI